MISTLFVDPQKTAFLVRAVRSLPNGKKTLADRDGRVYSLQPTKSWPDPQTPLFEDRDPGADGVFEQCDVDGQVATYWYVWEGVTVGPVSVAFFLVGDPA